MSYKNAADCLPPELVKELQKYVQGSMIYVPRTACAQWGSRSGLRSWLEERNAGIRALRQQGARLDHLADKFNLSVDAIRKILCRRGNPDQD